MSSKSFRGFKPNVQRSTREQTSSRDDGAGTAQASEYANPVQRSSDYRPLVPGHARYLSLHSRHDTQHGSLHLSAMLSS
jgi:hypothetical protein